MFRPDRPVAEGGDVWIDQTLFVGAPAGGMVGVGGMIENGDAEGFVSERALDVAPRGALLFALAAAQSVRVQMRLARDWLCPMACAPRVRRRRICRSSRRVPSRAANRSKSIMYASARFRCVNRDRIFFLEDDGSVRRDEFDEGTPGDADPPFPADRAAARIAVCLGLPSNS